MPAELIEALTSLDLILEEETAQLASSGYNPLLGQLVAAKTRAAGTIERHWLRLFGTGADPDALAPADRAALADRIGATLDRLRANAHLIERRIALCDDLLGAISAEAKRVSGGRSLVYGARGAIARNDQATPISINTSL